MTKRQSALRWWRSMNAITQLRFWQYSHPELPFTSWTGRTIKKCFKEVSILLSTIINGEECDIKDQVIVKEFIILQNYFCVLVSPQMGLDYTYIESILIDDVLKYIEDKPEENISDGLEPLANYGNLYSIEDFRQMVECGGIVNDDGFGYYATQKGQSNIVANLWFIESNQQLPFILGTEDQFTHVIWFNK